MFELLQAVELHEALQVDSTTHGFRRRAFERERVAEPCFSLLDVRIAEHEESERPFVEFVAREQLVLNERRRKHIAFEVDRPSRDARACEEYPRQL